MRVGTQLTNWNWIQIVNGSFHVIVIVKLAEVTIQADLEDSLWPNSIRSILLKTCYRHVYRLFRKHVLSKRSRQTCLKHVSDLSVTCRKCRKLVSDAPGRTLPKAPFTHRALPRRNARCRAATRVAAVVEHIVLTSLFTHRAATPVAAASMTLKLNWFNFSVILTRVAARQRASK